MPLADRSYIAIVVYIKDYEGHGRLFRMGIRIVDKYPTFNHRWEVKRN